MKELNDQIFFRWNEFDSGKTYRDLKFTKCFFKSCVVGLDSTDLAKRARLLNAEFHRCAIAACSLRATVLEDVLVEGLKTSGLFQTWAAVFKHVTLKGKIDRVMFSPFFHPGYPESNFQQVISQANTDFYADVDWALDIREAEFQDFDCRGVPSRLVRRDPATQIMVTRTKVLTCGEAIRSGGPFWESWLKLFLMDGWYQDGVLVAPKGSPKFKELTTGLDELRRHGIAEPD